IAMDAHVYNTRSVTIVEIMGRNAGWLTAAAVLARKYKGDNPALIYLPETTFSIKEFYCDLQTEMEKRQNVIVCVSEGIKDENGVFICEYSQEVEADNFGHKNLTGCGKQLEKMVKAKFGVKTRSVELNVTQRCVASMASLTDVNEAVMAAEFAVRASLAGKTAQMISCFRTENKPYEINYKCIDVHNVCNKEKAFPRQWIVGNDNDISNEFIAYATPFIQGEVVRQTENGLPKYCYLEEI
ncbi:MAG: 6-phosphofructokinase, partial [Oscillospiraceae bacterium]